MEFQLSNTSFKDNKKKEDSINGKQSNDENYTEGWFITELGQRGDVFWKVAEG